MPQDAPEPELSEIAAELGKLAPAGSRVNRDRLMYEAGFAAGRTSARGRRGWAWPSVAAALAFAVVAESAALAVRREPRVVVVERRIPTPDLGPGSPPRDGSLAQVRTGGPTAVPDASDDPGEPRRPRRRALDWTLDTMPGPTPLLSRAEAASGRGLDRSPGSSLRRVDTPRLLQTGGPS
ncbi:hypothetical protein OJF2_24200 [Aquisphaera giovannonii]|uniref:Uncharacterized protein n=1 Tax=Aquisphaera giovannonii TaxID=406548 RepID=A0A5B9W011_9BACT|nr:hypothetical protein [Aquisphaera giovannonii]QEH33888.1 hypothetical protein OJF2_24200 [Aquisphaera giovannonii]